MWGSLRRVGTWIGGLLGLSANVYTLAAAGGGAFIVAALSTAFSFVVQMPLLLRLALFVGVFLIVFALIGFVAKRVSSASADSGRPQVHRLPEGRTGIRTRGGSFRSQGTMRMRNQDRSIDSEDTDWEVGDTDVE